MSSASQRPNNASLEHHLELADVALSTTVMGTRVPVKKSNSRIKNRANFSVRCSEYELEQIREAAKRERRSVSAYVLNAVMNRVKAQAQARQGLAAAEKKWGPARSRTRPRTP